MVAQLHSRAIFQRRVIITDSAGNQTESYQDMAEVWADLKSRSANRRATAGQEHLAVTHRIIVRYRENLKTARRILIGDRVFSIDTVLDPGEKRRILHFSVTEGTLS